MKKADMKIEGMDCASCAVNLTKSFSKIGVKDDVNINAILGKASANVEDSVAEEDLRKAVEDVGFKLTEVEFE